MVVRSVFTAGNGSSAVPLQHSVRSTPPDFSGCSFLLCALGRRMFPNTFVQVDEDATV